MATEALQVLAKFRYHASIDLLRAFWQIAVDKYLQPYLASRYNGEALLLRTAPMGCAASPGHLAHFTAMAMACDMSTEHGVALAVADDILIGADSQQALADIIDRVCARLVQWGLTANVAK
jgi:hypothetical protein